MRAAIVLGKPGAGKGTQARLLENQNGAHGLSMGAVLRQLAAEDSARGQSANESLRTGALVAPEISRPAFLERLDSLIQDGSDLVVDGIRRASTLGDVLERLVPVSSIAGVFIEVPDSVARHRLRTRRYCPRCERSYGQLVVPKTPNQCDCGQPLERRTDDLDDAIDDRLARFAQELSAVRLVPGLEAFADVDGDRPPPMVFSDMQAALVSQWCG